VSSNHAPIYATMAMAVLCLIVALPALKGNSANIPFAFYAITAITAIGLYIAYVIPVYLRWRMGQRRRELRAAARRCRDPVRRSVVGRLGQELVHRPGDPEHERGRRRTRG
jgi:amino acid transporter